MQAFVHTICDWVGVTDPIAISIATGGVVASLIWFVGYIALMIALTIFSAILSGN